MTIFVVFFLIALLYSSVGFGGGSSYMAILVFMGMPFFEIRSIALCCNIAVISINIYNHWKEKNIPWKNTLFICSMSVPMAYIGSLLRFKEIVFLQILGISLIVAGVIIGLNALLNKNRQYFSPKNHFIVIIIGGVIGFLSGIIGIGGGIFLSPLLYLMRFENPQKIAAISSIFIAVNSMAAIIGLLHKGNFYFSPSFHLPLLLVVLLGATLGNKMRFKYFSAQRLALLTGLVVLYAGIKLLIETL